MYYVYIIQNQNNTASLKLRSTHKSYYVGATENLKERLRNHNWHTVKTTKFKNPKLIWYCCFKDKQKAYDFEKYLKSGSGFAFRNKHLI